MVFVALLIKCNIFNALKLHWLLYVQWMGRYCQLTTEKEIRSDLLSIHPGVTCSKMLLSRFETIQKSKGPEMRQDILLHYKDCHGRVRLVAGCIHVIPIVLRHLLFEVKWSRNHLLALVAGSRSSSWGELTQFRWELLYLSQIELQVPSVHSLLYLSFTCLLYRQKMKGRLACWPFKILIIRQLSLKKIRVT